MKKTHAPYLPGLHGTADLRALPASAMPDLAEEIRAFLVENVEKTGGHLASNLGVVELTLALHRVFDTPADHLIWDVGHQAYVHKIVTGRADRFNTLRQVGGLSGFTTRRESEYDPFGAGHSGTALSAAIGFAEADRLRGKDHYTVAVIGDGAYTGGMVHEALNNCDPHLPLVIILNENEMSISPNTGAFARYIAKLRASRSYMATKRATTAFLQKLPLIGKPLYRGIRRLTTRVRLAIANHNYFEDLGFLYLGPVNGNDYGKVEKALLRAKNRHGAVVLHIQTQKGKGYAPAEENPSRYHGVPPCTAPAPAETFHSVFGTELTAIAREDDRVTAITAAMGLGCGLDEFRAAFPDRFFDVGIAEEHAATFAAGMAAGGLVPVFAVYSTFLQRAYDNVLHDVALQDLPVKFFVDRAGLATADGPTHHGIFDVSFLSAIPRMHLYAPACYGTLRAAMRVALAESGPSAVRYPNAAEDARVAARFYPAGDFSAFGLRADFTPDAIPRNVIVAFGASVSRALDAAERANAENKPTGVLLVERLTPYADIARQMAACLTPDTNLIFYEEGVEAGGAAQCTLAALAEEMGAAFPRTHRVLAIHDPFAVPAEPTDLYRFCGISADDIFACLL